jgi:hypothetical protein
MDGHLANRASSIGAALSGVAGRGAFATAQAIVSTLRDWAAGACGGGRGSDDGALRAYRWLPACGCSAQPGPRRRAVAGRVGTAAVPYQELGVAPTGLAQGAHVRDAGQSRGGADPSAGSDEVSVAVGPGQRRTRTHVGRGTWRAAHFGSAAGTAVRRVPRRRCGRARAALQLAAAVSTTGGAYRARGRGTVHRRRSIGRGSWRHRGIVWTRPSPSVRGDLHRGNRGGARPDRGGDGGGARVVCDARTGAVTEARP